MINKGWTAKQVQQLKNLLAEGKSASLVAEALGRTKGSVIGYCNRNNIKLKTPTSRKKPGPVKVNDIKENITKQVIIPVTIEERKASLNSQVKTIKFIDLKASQCCFVVGDPNGIHTECCGRKIHRGVYCIDHAERCYIKRRG